MFCQYQTDSKLNAEGIVNGTEDYSRSLVNGSEL